MSPSSPTGNVDVDYEHAMELHRSGDLAGAMALYQKILEHDPTHWGTVHLLGVALSQQGQYPLAIQFIRSAITLNGSFPVYHVNLGNALMGANDPAQAEQAYGQALGLDQSLPEAWFGLGNARMASGRVTEAIAALEEAVGRRPDFPEALANLGSAYVAAGRPDEAIPVLDKAAGLKPMDARPRAVLAQALDAVGRQDEAGAVYLSLAELQSATPSMLFQAGNWLAARALHEPAVHLYRAALRQLPDEVALINNLANSLRELGLLERAKDAYERALALLPDDPFLLSNLGSLAKDRDDLDEAIRLGRRAVERGGDVLAHSNLGYAYYLKGDWVQAGRWFDRAAEIAPGDPDAVFHQGIMDLASGNWRRGWGRYESRWQRRRAGETLRHASYPQWVGGPLEGRTILIWSEQGLGDSLQFIRFAETLAERGGRVVAEVQRPLVSLFAQIPALAEVVAVGDAIPDHDVQTPLLSLPHALGLEVEALAPFHPYLRAPTDRSPFWRDWWAAHGHAGAPRIGLVWAGESRKHDVECLLIDRRRSVTLDTLGPVLALPGVDFVSLQLGPARQQLEPGILDPMDHVQDFADTAALIETLDAVVSVDTSVLHLAAAMGKPVFALSRFDGCWRWLRDRSDSPWYPSLRLYRQSQPGQWADVTATLKQDMAAWLQAR